MYGVVRMARPFGEDSRVPPRVARGCVQKPVSVPPGCVFGQPSTYTLSPTENDEGGNKRKHCVYSGADVAGSFAYALATDCWKSAATNVEYVMDACVD